MFTLTFLSLLYLHLGYQIGKKGWKVWKKKDSRSKTSMLFFPMSRRNRKVGKDHFPMDGGDSDEVGYKVLMTFGWLPLMALNLTIIGLAIGPESLLSRILTKRPSLAQRNARLALAARNTDRGLERQFKALETSASARPVMPEPAAAPPEAQTAPAQAPTKRRGAARRRDRRKTPPARRIVTAPSDPVTVRVEIDVNDGRKSASAVAAKNAATLRDDPFPPTGIRRKPDIH